MRDFYESEDTYGSAAKFADERMEKVLTLLSLDRPRRFLDVGCGDGYLCREVEERFGAQVAGVDVSVEAGEKARASGLRVETTAPEEPLPFPDGAFDTVFCGEVIEHVADTDFLLEEVHRVLSPRGYLLLTTPNLASWYNRLLLLLGIQPILTEVSYRRKFGHVFGFLGEGGKPVGHLRSFTRRSLVGLVESRGFEVLSVTSCGWLCSWKAPNLVYEIDKRVARLSASLGSNLVLRAQKREEGRGSGAR